jgi:hypothetical protein
VLNFQLA